MRRWLSAAELKLIDGLPNTERGIHKMAARLRAEKRKKRFGKGWEYDAATFPEPARFAINQYLLTNPSSFYSAGILAGLPGMPTTRSGVIRLAKREKWRYRPRVGRGGGREYHVSSLPHITRSYLAGDGRSLLRRAFNAISRFLRLLRVSP